MTTISTGLGSSENRTGIFLDPRKQSSFEFFRFSSGVLTYHSPGYIRWPWKTYVDPNISSPRKGMRNDPCASVLRTRSLPATQYATHLRFREPSHSRAVAQAGEAKVYHAFDEAN